MPAINPDPHRPGDPFLPEKCVTATFPRVDAAASAVTRLREAGFSDAQVQVFAGNAGASQLDVDGKKMSGFEKVLQALTQALADDAGYLDRANGVLKQGGALISVDTGDDEPVVRRAAGALKAAGGDGVQHWGQWRTEQF